jgi:hypothetical protein
VNVNPEIRKDGLLAIWRGLTTEPIWKYQELPPFLLPELIKLDLVKASDSELSRAMWFWLRRPELTFHASAALLVWGLCLLLSVAIALVARPGTSMPERFAEMIILLFVLAVEIYLTVQRIRFFRWRREYELSIDRLIRTIRPG